MALENQASLHNFYQVLEEDDNFLQTSYILQFLWQDMTSLFDCHTIHHQGHWK